jgi:hypothetical protein
MIMMKKIKQIFWSLQDGYVIHSVLCYYIDLSNSYMLLHQLHNFISDIDHIIRERKSLMEQNTENSNQTDDSKCNYIKFNQFLLL